jgi:hypothetical protein
MQTVSTCVTLDATNCLDCVAAGTGNYYSAEANVCYRPPHPPLAGFDGMARNYQQCPQTQVCQAVTINQVEEKSVSFDVPEGGLCLFKVTN